MNHVLVAIVAFCAFPCALGLSCYRCTPNENMPPTLCNKEGELTMVDCMGDNATCDMTKFVSNVSIPAYTTSYLLGCGNSSACDAKNSTVCAEAAASLENKTLALTMCETTCNPLNNSNKPEMVTPSPSTPVMMSTPSAPGDQTTMKPSAGDKLRPVFGVLFMVLFSVILCNPARQ